MQKRFPCRSAEYEYGSMRCALSDSDRRTAQHFVQLVDTPGTDYFEVCYCIYFIILLSFFHIYMYIQLISVYC